MSEQTSYLCITGSHPDVRTDIAAVPEFGTWDYMAIGLDAVDKYIWPIKYVATYHPEEALMIRERRKAVGGNLDYVLISHENKPGVQIIVLKAMPTDEKPSGSSALLGVMAALQCRYRRIVICGCPLTGVNAEGGSYETFRQGWRARKDEIAPYVRSMSGWTAELLGKPTKEWLMGANA